MAPQAHADHGIVDTDYYSFVDGLRGLAILMVLSVHSTVEPLTNPVLDKLVASGARGVQLFFILSAFTLFSSSLQRFPCEHSPRRNFYVRRAFRILPLWWLACIVFLIAKTLPQDEVGGAVPGIPSFLMHATFLFGFDPYYVHALVPGGWSLFVEETFYIMLPLVQTRIRTPYRAAGLILALLVASAAWYLPARAVLEKQSEHAAAFVFTFPLSQWFIFGLGIALFFLFKSSGPRVLKGAVAWVADVTALVTVWSAFVGTPPGPRHYTAAFALFFVCVAVSQKDSLLRRLIDNPVIRLFGRCCYSIYLFHWLAIVATRDFRGWLLGALGLRNAAEDLKFLVWFPFIASICLVLGVVSFYCLEKPMVNLGRKAVKWLEGGSSMAARRRTAHSVQEETTRAGISENTAAATRGSALEVPATPLDGQG